MGRGRRKGQHTATDRKGSPHKPVAGYFIQNQPRSRVTHVEDVPKLSDRQCEERHRHRFLYRQEKMSLRKGGQ